MNPASTTETYAAIGLGDQATSNGLRFRINPENRVTLILVGNPTTGRVLGRLCQKLCP